MRRPRDQLGAGLGVLAALAVDILLASCACTFSETSARVCTNSDVLAFVVNRYNDANVRPEIVPSMAAQYPTAAPDTVLCTVYLRGAVYDSAKYGNLPEIVLEPRFFRVKALAEGFEVTFSL